MMLKMLKMMLLMLRMMFESRDLRKIGLNCGEYEVEGIDDNYGDAEDDDGCGYEMRMMIEGGAKRQIGLKCCSKEYCGQ